LGGLPVHTAVATSLVIIAMKSFSGFAKYLAVLAEQNLALDWRVLATVTALGIAGSYAGTHVGRRIPQQSLRRLFGAFLVIMAVVIVARTAPAVLPGR
ncbi:MAG: sulfite exporter TauE/SafE family protein, partial [Gammaproteobacteria bacterium]